MRHLIIAGTAAVFLASPAIACEFDAADATAPQVAATMPIVSVELAAATDKDKKPAKKKAVKKKEKVEYMRSAAGPEPKPAKKKAAQ